MQKNYFIEREVPAWCVQQTEYSNHGKKGPKRRLGHLPKKNGSYYVMGAQYDWVPGETVVLSMRDQVRMWGYCAFMTFHAQVTSKL